MKYVINAIEKQEEETVIENMTYQSEKTGTRLRCLRKQNGYSRKQVAERIGRSTKYYSDIERGTCGMSIKTLIDLADLYHVSLDFLVAGVDEYAKQQDESVKWLVKSLGCMKEEEKKRLIDIVSLLMEQGRKACE